MTYAVPNLTDLAQSFDRVIRQTAAQAGAPLLALGICLVVTFSWWFVQKQELREREGLRFAEVAHRVATSIEEQMATDEQLIVSLAAIEEMRVRGADDFDWVAYVTRLNLDMARSFPNAAFLERVEEADLARHERSVRARGAKNYAVWPGG